MANKVLIITYYWFPSEGTGVYRVSRFVKYLKQKGWQPIVLTARQSAGTFEDEDKTSEFADIPVYRSKIWEPLGLFGKFSGKKQEAGKISPTVFLDKKANWKVKLATWLRLNLFLPDAKKFWRKPAVRLGKKIIKEQKPVLIFSTSPPPTTNLIAMDLAKWSKLPWVADFRDPWTKIYYLEQAPVTSLANRINEKLERKALQRADHITAVNDGFFPHLNIKQKQTRISNGFDPDDYPKLRPAKPSKFIMRYFGQWKDNQLPPAFFDVLKQLSHSPEYCQKIALECYGTTSQNVRNKLAHPSIRIDVTYHEFIPKTQAVRLMMNAGLLLLFIGQSNISRQLLSTKIFDYLYARRPIVGYGPVDGSAAKVLQETGCGRMFNYEDRDGAYNLIVRSYKAWQKNEQVLQPNQKAIAAFDFNNLTDRLIDVFQNVLNHEPTPSQRS
jgi:hypothetical protein